MDRARTNYGRVNRRQFGLALAAPLLYGQGTLDDVLRSGISRRGIPCAAAMVANSRSVLYQGAFGRRDIASQTPVTLASIFAIASMTKAITTVAALQMVEQGKVKLDEPVDRWLRSLRGIRVFTGFDAQRQAQLRAPARPVTLRHLLTHTSGLCYDIWNADLRRYVARTKSSAPLMFDPGSRWEYGTGIDFAGFLVEALSGMNLEAYFQQRILGPLEMQDTSYLLPPAKFERLAGFFRRGAGGRHTMDPRVPPRVPKAFIGGAGLFSTCADYVKFMQMVLRRGAGVLSEESVRLMTTNQTGNLRAGVLKTANPALSADVDLHPGASDRYTLGFLMNPEAYPGGRSAGSLAWAGIGNTFYWIDPARDLCAVLMMQFVPFVHPEATGLLADFERAVYATVAKAA